VSDEPTSSKKIKVVDRRWFNESGELRAPRPPATGAGGGETKEERPEETARPAGSSGSEARPRGATPQTPGAGPQEGGPGKVRRPSGAEFPLIVDLLAQQAAVLLTGAQGIEKNRSQARLFIDLLDILQEKTEGRLAPEEAAYLRDVLAQLQLAFVESGP